MDSQCGLHRPEWLRTLVTRARGKRTRPSLRRPAHTPVSAFVPWLSLGRSTDPPPPLECRRLLHAGHIQVRSFLGVEISQWAWTPAPSSWTLISRGKVSSRRRSALGNGIGTSLPADLQSLPPRGILHVGQALPRPHSGGPFDRGVWWLDPSSCRNLRRHGFPSRAPATAAQADA